MRATTLLSLALLAGCGGGSTGDELPVPEPDVAGGGMRLRELNDPGNPRPSPDEDVIVTGVVVLATDAFDETADGASAGNLFVQDLGDPLPYGGITVFDPSFSPPALRVAPGDVLDARGRYEEFAGPSSAPFAEGRTLPELVGATLSLRFEHRSPEPITIPVSDLRSYETGRRWIGMLVRVENVRLFSDPFISPSGRYSARLDVGVGAVPSELPTLTNALFDVSAAAPTLAARSTLRSVTGIVQYFYGFSVAPRGPADLEP